MEGRITNFHAQVSCPCFLHYSFQALRASESQDGGKNGEQRDHVGPHHWAAVIRPPPETQFLQGHLDWMNILTSGGLSCVLRPPRNWPLATAEGSSLWTMWVVTLLGVANWRLFPLLQNSMREREKRKCLQHPNSSPCYVGNQLMAKSLKEI